MFKRKDIRRGDWKPILLWVKHPDAPPEKAILLDLDRCEYFDSECPEYRIKLRSHKGLDMLIDACLFMQALHFGLTRGEVGRLFTGLVVEYELFYGPAQSMEIRVKAPRFDEYDLSESITL